VMEGPSPRSTGQGQRLRALQPPKARRWAQCPAVPVGKSSQEHAGPAFILHWAPQRTRPVAALRGGLSAPPPPGAHKRAQGKPCGAAPALGGLGGERAGEVGGRRVRRRVRGLRPGPGPPTGPNLSSGGLRAPSSGPPTRRRRRRSDFGRGKGVESPGLGFLVGKMGKCWSRGS
jgi:hypothetical protein